MTSLELRFYCLRNRGKGYKQQLKNMTNCLTKIYAPYATPVHFIVHDGPEQPSRHLLMAAGLWAAELHDEILVFDQGFWNKSAALWEEIQKADWKDVILEKERKDSMHKDMSGFTSYIQPEALR